MTIRFGSEICGDRAQVEQREWLISNGLGSYGCGTVAGTRTRSYHGLLVAALGAPADPCTRTLLVAALEEHWGLATQCGGWTSPTLKVQVPEGVQALDEPAALAGVHALEALTPIDHRAITAFRLEGTVPCWRFALGDAADYIVENSVAIIAFYNGEIVTVEIPASVELTITETEPGIQGDRVSGARKPATLQTGKVVQVPLFINTGDKVKVDTRSGEYITRV